MSKIGLLVECGRDGLEVVMCRRIVELLNQEHGSNLQLDPTPMDNKKRLIEECGTATADLLTQGCERVLILWDERPAWPKLDEKLCWHNDRVQVLAELTKAGVRKTRVDLICIEREMESWLLYDHAMLASVLSRPTRSVRVPSQKHPDRMKNPKGVMTRLFNQLAGKTYVDVQCAKDFATHLTSLNRLRKCPTFKRFEEKLTGKG